MFRIMTLLFLLSITTTSYAQVPQDVKNNIRLRVEKGDHPSIVVGLIEGDKTYFFSYGVKSLITKDSASEHSIYEIGSISKTFTGILLADRVLKGKMALEDPLQKYLPAGITAPTRNGASIKLVQMSNHTSSLPRMPDNFTPKNPANPFVDYTEKQLYDFLQSYKLPRDIGSQYEYSNYAVGLLGYIMAAQQGTTYEQLLSEIITKPLGLTNTAITLTPTMKKNLAMGHASGQQVENWDIVTLAGAGAIRSDAVDMLNYIRANMGKTKSKLYPAMQLSHKNTRSAGAAPKVGLGWHISAGEGTQEIVWHNGGTGGYRSFSGFINGGTKGVVVLTNSAESADDIGMHLLNPGAPLNDPTPAKEFVVDEKTLDSYVGKYELAPGFILTVTRAGSQLNVQATGQPQFPVFAKENNVFFLKVVKAELTFNPNADTKQIESVTLLQGGSKMTGKKLAD